MHRRVWQYKITKEWKISKSYLLLFKSFSYVFLIFYEFHQNMLTKLASKGESYIDFCTQYVRMTQTRWLSQPLPFPSFPVFRQNWYFFKTCLNIFIRGSTIHQTKSWYYLGLLQISKVELFAKIAFGFKSITFFVKSSKLDVLLDTK